jgi:hemolysin activation/secretion protein
VCVLAAVAQPQAGATAVADPGVEVGRFEFRYGLEHPQLPPLDALSRLNVRLARGDDGVWRQPAPSQAGEILTLGRIPSGSRFDASALRAVAQELVSWYNSLGLYGVWIAYRELEAGAEGMADRRPAGDTTARLVIWASQVAEVRTLARGQRIKAQDSVNHRKHRNIARFSPLQPPAAPDLPGSLFRRDLLDRYLFGLSQHPGRLVEASIASAGEPGKVVLDYLVNESRPWQVFGQFTNFGTEATGEWRGRLGFQHNQLTNHDDILNIDAISTPDFKTYGSFLSYRIPVIRPAKLLARVYGSYGDFLANDVAIQNLRFAGRNWLVGAELTHRLTLPRQWLLTSALGANFAHYGIQSRIITTPLVTGYSDFLLPFLSTTLSHDGGWWSLSANLRYDRTVGDFANLNTTNGIPSLGRVGADSEWASLRWNLTGSVFLEGLFGDPMKASRLPANEVAFRFRGRTLLEGSRLIPHEQEPIGGAFTVRGYAESVLSADEFVLGSVEYVLHLPRLLKPGAPGRFIRQKWPFKWRPDKPRQDADWDLMVRAFYDHAYRQVTPQPLEIGQTEADLGLVDRTVSLSGAGGGLEVRFKQFFSLRCDVGVTLTELRDPTREENQRLVVPAGDVRYYFSSSFTW